MGYKETRYDIGYSMWKYDYNEDDYTVGPYEYEMVHVDTEEEAQKRINKWKAEHPNWKDFDLKFSENDPDESLIKETLICALIDKKICEYQYQFYVIKVESNLG